MVTSLDHCKQVVGLFCEYTSYIMTIYKCYIMRIYKYYNYGIYIPPLDQSDHSICYN